MSIPDKKERAELIAKAREVRAKQIRAAAAQEASLKAERQKKLDAEFKERCDKVGQAVRKAMENLKFEVKVQLGSSYSVGTKNYVFTEEDNRLLSYVYENGLSGDLIIAEEARYEHDEYSYGKTKYTLYYPAIHIWWNDGD